MNDIRTRRAKNSTQMRRRQLGAIYVEALMVIMLNTIIFAVAMFFGAAYLAKLGAFAQATAQAFQTAGKGCGPPLGGSYSVADMLAKAAPDPSSPDLAFLGTQVMAQAGQSTMSIQRAAFLGSPTTWTFNVESQLMCNEKAMSADEAWKWLGGVDWAVNGMLQAGGLN
jgi:hypothetical protein